MKVGAFCIIVVPARLPASDFVAVGGRSGFRVETMGAGEAP